MSATGNQSQESGGVKKTVTVVGFGLRLAATLLDTMFVGFLTMMLIMAVGITLGILGAYTPDLGLPLESLTVGVALVFSVAYYVASWAKSGQTIGKMTVGIKIVGADGKPPSGGVGVLRYIGYIVSGLVVALGFLWVVFDRKRQGWHDKLAKTYVVYSDAHFSDIDAVELVPSDPKPGWPWVVLWTVFAIGLPLSGVTALLTLGPLVGTMVANFFTNLR
jgi:uncharacterized RDD family membrane protein YckC